MIIRLESVAKRYTGKYVFRDVSLEAQTGHVLCLAGPNGSGKTTLLKILCGLLRPTSGGVMVEHSGPPCAPAELRTTFGIQTPRLLMYDDLTVRENLDFVLTMRGAVPAQSRVPELLRGLGLEDAADRPARDLSSGMRQKMTLAAALAHGPEALFLDEPTSFLDSEGRARVRDIVADLRDRTLIVIATNDPEETQWGDHTFELGR